MPYNYCSRPQIENRELFSTTGPSNRFGDMFRGGITNIPSIITWHLAIFLA